MKKILLADDEESILLAYSRLLKSPGVHIEPVDSFDGAMARLKESRYDALIVDMRLEGTDQLDGLELASFARTHYPTCFIVVLTAFGDETVQCCAKEAGADLFIQKPVSPMKLKAALAERGII